MKLILIHESIEDDDFLLKCFNSDCITKKVSEFNGYLQVLETVSNLNDITHLTFVYRFLGDFNVPFFDIDTSSNYQYFNNNIISLFNLLKTYNEKLIIDILSCNLNDDSFVESVDNIENDLKVNIRYSLDQTGNEPDANWLLESDNVNVKNDYFIDIISYWTGKLDSTYSNYTTSYTLGNTYSYVGSQYTITESGTIISVNIFSAIWYGAIKCYMRKFTAATGTWSEIIDGTWITDNQGTISTVKWRKVPLPQTITVVAGDKLEIRHTSLETWRLYQCGLNAGVPITSFTVENNITTITSPLTVSTPCLLWLDAADLSSNGAAVNTWNDKSGQGNNATGFNNHNGVGTFPTVLTNTLNNKSVINLSGTNDYFKINNNLSIYEVTFVILVKILAVPGTQYVRYGIINTDRPGFYGYGIGFYGFSPTASSSYKFELLSNDAFTNTTVSVDNTGNTWYILTATYNANTNYAIFTYNGTILSPNVGVGAGPVDANEGIKIGIWNTSYSTNTSCYVAEAIIYNGVLSNGERQSVEGYLATKWGMRNNLPSTHPFFLGNPPGAPTSVTATPGNGQATVSWIAPSSNGSSAIISYTVTSSPGGLSATTTNGSTTSATVTGLTNGTIYTFTVRANNIYGTSATSTASNSVIPSIPPNTPTNIYAVAGNTNAAISWSAPTSNGGTSVTSYTITSTPGNITKTTSLTYGIISGLTNGISYTFTVYATNSGGNGTASVSSNSIIPNSNLYIYLDSTVPSSYPGSGSTWTSIPNESNLILQLNNTTFANGIVFNGTAYAGRSGSLIPTFPSTPLTIIYWLNTSSTDIQSLFTLNRTSSNIINQLYIGTNTMFDHGNNFGFNSNYTFSIPTNTITQFVFKRNGTTGFLYTNGVLRQNITANLSVTYGSTDLYVGVNYRDINNPAIDNFFSGTIYAIKVFSSALSDTDITSEYNNGITPSAPFNAVGTVSGNTATLAWSASLFKGYGQTPNYLIYDATSNTLLQTITNSSTTSIVPINSSSNLYIIASNNINSINYNSSMVYFTETYLTPNEPRNVSIVSGNNQVTLSWSAPTSNGSSSVTGYRIEKSVNNINWTVDVSNNSTTSYISSGLSNGLTYYFRIYAINSNGLGMVSSTVSQTLNSVAQQISSVIAIPYHQSVDLSWNTPINTGSDISSYLIESSTNGSSWTQQSSNTKTTYYTVSGLTNETLYYFRVSSINAAGTSSPSTSVTTTPIVKPDTPTINEIIGGNRSMNIFYTQNDNGGPTVSRYRFTTDSGQTVFNRNIGLVRSPWYIRTLTNNQTYNIQISSYNSNGWSKWSNFYSVTPNDIRSNNLKNELNNISKNNIGNVSTKLLNDINSLSLNQARQFIHDLADDISGQSNEVKKAALLSSSLKMSFTNNSLKNVINEELENYGVVRNIPFDISDQVLVNQLIDISSQFKFSNWSPSKLSFILPTLNNEITINLNNEDAILSLEPDIAYTLTASYNGILSSNQYSMTYYRTDISRYVTIDNQEKLLGENISFMINNKVRNFKFTIFGSPGGSSQDPGAIIDKASTYNGKSVIITFEPTTSNNGNGTVFGIMNWSGDTGLTIRGDTTSNIRWERHQFGTITTFDSRINGASKFIAVTTFDESGNQFSAELYTWDGNTEISNVYSIGLTDLSTNTVDLGDDYRNTLGTAEYNFSNDIFKGYIYNMFLSSSKPSISELQNIINQYNIIDNGATITFNTYNPYYDVTGVKVGGININNNRFYLDGASNFIRLDPGGSYSLDTTLSVSDLSAYSFNGITSITFTEPSDLSGINFYKVVFSETVLNTSEIYDFSSNGFVGTINVGSVNNSVNKFAKWIDITGLVNQTTYYVYVMSYNDLLSNSVITYTTITHKGGIYNPRRYSNHLTLTQEELNLTIYDIFYDINGEWMTLYKNESDNIYYLQNVYVNLSVADTTTYPTIKSLFDVGNVSGFLSNIPSRVIQINLNSSFNFDGLIFHMENVFYPNSNTGYGPTLSIPDQIENFTVNPSNTSINLTWSETLNSGGSNILGYALYYYKTSDGSGVNATDISGITNLNYNVTGLLTDTEYTFTIFAYNTIGNGLPEIISIQTQINVTITFDDTQNYVGGYLIVNYNYSDIDITFNWYTYTDSLKNNPILLSNPNNRNYLFTRLEYQNLYIGVVVNYGSETFTSSLIQIQEKYNPETFDYRIEIYTVGQKQSLFNTATYHYPNVSTPPTYNLELNLNQMQTLFTINRSKTYGSNQTVRINSFENSWTNFNERLLEIAATKIFGHPKARAAISNDITFTDISGLAQKISDSFNQHKNDFGDYYMGVMDINTTNSESQPINVSNFDIIFPFNLKGSTLSNPNTIYQRNGPNVGGTLLQNGIYDIPLLLQFK
jgi:hypothetical protein